MTESLRRICVYCGSNPGRRDIYTDGAVELANALVDRDIELVYGGAAKGLMGVIADRVLERGGKVHGVIPRFLVDREIAHTGLTELHVVESMHERKTLMAELADGFVAMPGGFGTLEEIIEVLTWGQLRMHDKPCGLLNVNGYFDALLKFLDGAEQAGFVSEANRRMLLAGAGAGALIDRFAAYQPPLSEKWISP